VTGVVGIKTPLPLPGTHTGGDVEHVGDHVGADVDDEVVVVVHTVVDVAIEVEAKVEAHLKLIGKQSVEIARIGPS
jgi:hypothetical protein